MAATALLVFLSQAIVVIYTVGTGMSACSFCCVGALCGVSAGAHEVSLPLRSAAAAAGATCSPCAVVDYAGMLCCYSRPLWPSQLADFDDHVALSQSKWSKRCEGVVAECRSAHPRRKPGSFVSDVVILYSAACECVPSQVSQIEMVL